MFPTGLNKIWQRISNSLFQTGENTLEVYNGVKPQALYVYNTKTGGGYERFYQRWVGNTFTTGTEADGTGTQRGVSLTTPSYVIALNATAKLSYFHWGDARVICDMNGSMQYRTWGGNSGYLSLYPGSPGSSVAPVISMLWYTQHANYSVYAMNVSVGGYTFAGGIASGLHGEVLANPSFDPFTVTYTSPSAGPTAAKIVGANTVISAGNGSSGSTGAANGGNVTITGGTGYGTGTKGIVTASRLRAVGFATAATAKTADYTATLDDSTIEVDASGAARTITLFTTVGNAGKIIVVKKTDSSANAVTIDGNATETIDGAATVVLSTQWATVTLQVNAEGTAWFKI